VDLSSLFFFFFFTSFSLAEVAQAKWSLQGRGLFHIPSFFPFFSPRFALVECGVDALPLIYDYAHLDPAQFSFFPLPLSFFLLPSSNNQSSRDED